MVRRVHGLYLSYFNVWIPVFFSPLTLSYISNSCLLSWKPQSKRRTWEIHAIFSPHNESVLYGALRNFKYLVVWRNCGLFLNTQLSLTDWYFGLQAIRDQAKILACVVRLDEGGFHNIQWTRFFGEMSLLSDIKTRKLRWNYYTQRKQSWNITIKPKTLITKQVWNLELRLRRNAHNRQLHEIIEGFEVRGRRESFRGQELKYKQELELIVP